MPTRSALWIAAFLTGIFGSPLQAQVVLDEGTFNLTLRGEVYGTETFSIRRTGAGEDTRVVAHGQVRIDHPSGRRDMAPALQAVGLQMVPFRYQIKISGATQEDLRIERSGGRLVSRMISERGERMSEYRASPDALMLDDEVAHQFFFLGQRMANGDFSAPVIVPRASRQVQMQITNVGMERLEIAAQPVSARHVRLDGGGRIRDVWLDGEGRVLAVEDPGTGYRAIRQELPF
jgi:hypothetical protein